jgi:hypothetical protein
LTYVLTEKVKASSSFERSRLCENSTRLCRLQK